MRKVWPGAFLLVVIAGAGASYGGPPPPPAPIITLRPLTLSQEGRPIARLLADGRMDGTGPDSTGKPAHWVPGPTLRADGTILLTKGGFTARVERNGAIYVVGPAGGSPREQLFGRIAGNAGFPNTIEGPVDARVQHTALVMTAAFFLDMSITAR